MIVWRMPDAIETNGVGPSLIESIFDFVVQPSTKFVDQILKNSPALSESPGEASIDILEQLFALDGEEIFS